MPTQDVDCVSQREMCFCLHGGLSSLSVIVGAYPHIDIASDIVHPLCRRAPWSRLFLSCGSTNGIRAPPVLIVSAMITTFVLLFSHVSTKGQVRLNKKYNA